MSEESPLQDNKSRPLRAEELEILTGLLQVRCESLVNQLKDARVQEMDDGQMGGVKFEKKSKQIRKLGKKCAEAKYIDTDGIEVNIVINLDTDGDLYEVDFWKVDFSPLCKYPSLKDLAIL